MKLRNKTRNITLYTGFTLLELIVAIALMDMIALSLYSSLYITARSKRNVTDAIRPYQRLIPVFDELREDLQAAMQPNGILAGGFYGEDLSGGQNQDSDILQFCCASYAPQEDEIASNIIEVVYELTVDAEQQENVLVRKITVNLLSSKTVDISKQEVIGRGIRSFNLRYYDGYSWLDTWDSTTMDNQLPMAVEVTLTAETDLDKNRQRDVLYAEGKELTCRRIYLLSCAEPLTSE
jgi:type II secretion system protein J